MSFVADRRVLVTGAGVTGQSIARALVAAGAVVTMTDESARRLARLEPALPGVVMAPALSQPPAATELIVTSPGWRPDNPIFIAAAQAGIEVIGDVELAWRMAGELADPPQWLAITGTNGKTTTVGMLEAILRAAGVDAIACGNVGLPVIDAILAGHRVLAVELSSFQLYWAPSLRPFASVILNVADDHLDWHGGIESYAAAKARIFATDIGIAYAEDFIANQLLDRSSASRKVTFTLNQPKPGQLGIRDGLLVDRAFAEDESFAQVDSMRLRSTAGLLDALAAAGLAKAYGIPGDAIERGLADFTPAGHRSVLVAELDGVRYINDSKATNPHAAATALRSHASVVWIAGGLLKGASVDSLIKEEGHRMRGVVLIGADSGVIAAALARFAPAVPVALLNSPQTTMTEVVRAARSMARPGDVVLLAPAAASMDMFTDYTHRGRAFAESVLLMSGRAPST